MYLSSAAVFMAEALKLPYCVLMVARVGGGFRGLLALVRSEITGHPAETFKCAVPALAYTIQGNLLFLALSNLDAPTYQVTYQTKTLFTALFSRMMLGRTLAHSQWLALALLFVGAVLVSDLCVACPCAPPAPKGPAVDRRVSAAVWLLWSCFCVCAWTLPNPPLPPHRSPPFSRRRGL
jgi:multidrug transporter EmrE-like cation transporter